MHGSHKVGRSTCLPLSLGGDKNKQTRQVATLRVRPLLARPELYNKDGVKALSPRNHDVMHLKRHDRSIVSTIPKPKFFSSDRFCASTYLMYLLNNVITKAHQHYADTDAPPEP